MYVYVLTQYTEQQNVLSKSTGKTYGYVLIEYTEQQNVLSKEEYITYVWDSKNHATSLIWEDHLRTEFVLDK